MKIKKKVLMEIFVLLIMSGLVIAFTTVIRDTTTELFDVNVSGNVIMNDTNITGINYLEFTTLKGSIGCGNLSGGTDADFCADATSTYTDPFIDVDNIYIWNNSGTITLNETKLNKTSNGTIDSRVTVSFLQNLLDTIYLAIANLGTSIQNETIIRNGLNESWVNKTVDEPTILRSSKNASYFKSFDSNASTACNNNEVLLGDGTCYDLGNIQNSTRNRTGNVIYAQLSDLKDQPFAATNTPQPLNFSTEDEIYGLVHSTTVVSSEITIVNSAIYTMIAQPQVATGAGGAGTFHMWLEKWDTTQWINISNTNVELVLASNEENVIPLIATLKLEPDEKIRVMGSVSDTAIKLDAQSPAGEPTIPSIIFSMFEVGGTNLSYIGNCSGATCDVTNTGTLDGYEAAALLDNTFNSSKDMQTAINITGLSYVINVSGALFAYDLGCTNCIGGTEIAELSDADISNTLTCSIFNPVANVAIGDYNFSVNTSVLYVDSTNDRIGIGTITPTVELDVVGTINSTKSKTTNITISDGTDTFYWYIEGSNLLLKKV